MIISGWRSPRLVAQLRLLPQQVDQFAALLLHEGVRKDGGNRRERRGLVCDAGNLPVHSFPFQPLRLGLGHGRVQIGELLHHDALAAFD